MGLKIKGGEKTLDKKTILGLAKSILTTKIK